eukprot:COSAG02_NODE_1232_length_13753_cov_164.373810_12_plen_205_part_00
MEIGRWCASTNFRFVAGDSVCISMGDCQIFSRFLVYSEAALEWCVCWLVLLDPWPLPLLSSVRGGNPICEGVLLFDCGKYGWDGSLSPGMPLGQYWVTFDLGTIVAVDAFALWNDGRGGWDVRNFAIQTATSPTGGGGWEHVANATNLAAKTSYGGLQVFDGFQAASRYWRWYITGTGGNQPWVKEVQFRKQEKKHVLDGVEQW